jgi:hypothetical protein
MAFNGSGVFNLVAGNPVVTGTTISSTWANNTLSDIATGLSTTITKDGQTTPTANIPMGGFKFTGLGAGTATGNSLRFEQLFSQGIPVALASAATVDIGGQNSVAVEISGTTTITSLGTNYNGPRFVRFTGALLLTYNSTTLNLPGATDIVTAAGDVAVFYPNLASDGWNLVSYQRAAALSPIVRGYISGLILSNNAGDPTNDIDIASGMAADSASLYMLSLTGPFTKRLDAAWAVGSGNGGLDTGAIANALYNVFVIRKDSDGSIDALFSLSATAPTMPAGYTAKRRLGSILRVGATIRTFIQTGDRVYFKTPTLDYDNNALGTTAATPTLNVPPNTIAILNVYLERSGAAASAYINPTAATAMATSDTAAPLTTIETGASGAPVVLSSSQVEVLVDASSQIRVVASAASTTLRIAPIGYIDNRGKDA